MVALGPVGTHVSHPIATHLLVVVEGLLPATLVVPPLSVGTVPHGAMATHLKVIVEGADAVTSHPAALVRGLGAGAGPVAQGAVTAHALGVVEGSGVTTLVVGPVSIRARADGAMATHLAVVVKLNSIA